ncbi:unnamed protein product [Caenorhabditis brenneri]
MNSTDCTAPEMDGYSNLMYYSGAISCAIPIVSILYLLFQKCSVFIHYKKHAIFQLALTIPHCFFVSVLLHPVQFHSLINFEPAGKLSTLGVSGLNQFNFLISDLLVNFLALVEESILWYSLIVFDKFSNQFLPKLVKTCQKVNRLTCLSSFVFSAIMLILHKFTVLGNGTCPFSFSLSFDNFSAWGTYAICTVACSSFCLCFVASIYLAKAELFHSCHSRPMKNNYRTLLNSLIMRMLISIFLLFAAPPALEFIVQSSDYASVILKMSLINQGTLLTIILLTIMIRVQFYRSRIGVIVIDPASNSVHSIRI